MVTMLLGGLWHGANWTFVAWGGLHGFYLWVEKFFRDRKSGAKEALQPAEISEPRPAVVTASMGPQVHLSGTFRGFLYAMLTFFLINVTWVFFRANSFGRAGQMLESMFGGAPGSAPILTTMSIIKVVVIITGMILIHWFMRNRRVLDLIYKIPWWVTGILWSVILLLLILSQESSSSFIYFQF
jgi:D-alanyl-lipoteichoic acid acyltransferase DltB (MBOAT superfamily)